MSRAGRPNKNKAFLMSRLQEMYGDDFDPIINMAEVALKLHKEAMEGDPDIVTLKSSVDAWDKIAQYVQPKLKAVEVSGDAENPVAITEVILRGVRASDD